MKNMFLSFNMTPYVILFIERDGSTYLTSLLSSHPRIEAVYERFAVLENKGASGKDQNHWAEQYWTKKIINTSAARGFKTKLINVLDLPGFKNILLKKNVHIIQMHRLNQVKAVVSKINAKRLHDQSGFWNLYKETDRMPPMKIDTMDFQNLLNERETLDHELTTFVDSLPNPKLVINYEDLLSNRDDSLHKIFDFLNVKFFPVEGKTLKHTSDDLREVILNFEELKNNYKNTKIEAMFDEIISTSDNGKE